MIRDFLLFLQGLFHPKPYFEALHARLSFGRVLLFQYLLITAVVIVGFIALDIFVYHELRPQLKGMPELQIVNGQIVTPLPAPKSFTLFKEKLFVIDPSKTVSQVLDDKTGEKPEGGYLLKDGYIRYDDGKSKITQFDADENRTIGPSEARMFFLVILLNLVLFSPVISAILMVVLLCLSFFPVLFCIAIAAGAAYFLTPPLRPAKIATTALMLWFFTSLLRLGVNFIVHLPMPVFYALVALALYLGLALYQQRQSVVKTPV